MSDLQAEFRRVIRAAGVAHNIPDEQIALLTTSAWEMLTHTLGCERVYVPAASKAARDSAIFSAWRQGQTVEAIAKQHDVSSKTVLRVIHRKRTKARQSLAPRAWELT